jgi:glycogen(starch) synthase
MNVLHVTRDFPPRHCGGISTAVGGLARAQSRAGLAVSVVSFDGWRPRAAPATCRAQPVDYGDDISVLRLSSPAQLAAARAFAQAQRPALLHVHHGMLWEFATTLRAERTVPIVKTVHVVQRHMNELRGTREHTLSLAGQEAALAGADRVIAPSHAAAEALLAYYPTLAPRLRVVGHGIDDTPAAYNAAARHAETAARGALLAVGRFADAKGTPELFEVMRRVLAEFPAAALTVAGGVPANQRAETRWLRRWRMDTPEPLRARVRFTGWLDSRALGAAYGAAAALVLASRYETFGLVALEAMLHGLPVAATAAGGVAELIIHGETGLLSAPGDAQALAEHALALLSDRELAGRLGCRAAAAVRSTRLWTQVLPAMLAVYGELS